MTAAAVAGDGGDPHRRLVELVDLERCVVEPPGVALADVPLDRLQERLLGAFHDGSADAPQRRHGP